MSTVASTEHFNTPAVLPVLRAQNITKKFGGVTALNGVSFDLRPGEIHALCGENGAGKSTLIKLLSGIHPHGSYEGELFVNEKTIALRGVADAEKSGIAVIYQELALVPEMSVAENIFLGAEPTRFGFIDWDEVYSQTQVCLERFNLKVKPTVKISHLGIGQRQLLEIIKALRKNSKILILDEPTAALTETEVAVLLETLRDLRGHGVSCIYISHKLDEVFGIADRVTVLRDGQSIITARASEITKQAVIRHMVGREIQDLFPRKAPIRGKPLMRVVGLTVADEQTGDVILKNISFEVHAGEVLGLGGLMGAGRTELLMHLFGAWGKRLKGEVEINGQLIKSEDPRAMIKRGLVLVSEDRRRYGLFFEKTVGFNLSLSTISRFRRHLFVDASYELDVNQKLFASLRVKATGLESPVAGLSGGNQQKVVLGKALMTEPAIILLDEPTRGIDVGAKQEVYEIMNQLTHAGKAVVLASSELPELIGMSERILMMRDGAITKEFYRVQASPESLMAAALGHTNEAAV